MLRFKESSSKFALIMFRLLRLIDKTVGIYILIRDASTGDFVRTLRDGLGVCLQSGRCSMSGSKQLGPPGYSEFRILSQKTSPHVWPGGLTNF